MHLCEPISPAAHISNQAGLMLRIFLLIALLLVAPFLAGCRHNDPPEPAAASGAAANVAITLSSSSLQDGTIPKEFTCDGGDQSPSLAWSAPPAETKSLVLTETDPDAPGGTFTHWVLYNLPANTNGLAASRSEAGAARRRLPAGTQRLRQDRLWWLLPASWYDPPLLLRSLRARHKFECAPPAPRVRRLRKR